MFEVRLPGAYGPTHGPFSPSCLAPDTQAASLHGLCVQSVCQGLVPGYVAAAMLRPLVLISVSLALSWPGCWATTPPAAGGQVQPETANGAIPPLHHPAKRPLGEHMVRRQSAPTDARPLRKRAPAGDGQKRQRSEDLGQSSTSASDPEAPAASAEPSTKRPRLPEASQPEGTRPPGMMTRGRRRREFWRARKLEQHRPPRRPLKPWRARKLSPSGRTTPRSPQQQRSEDPWEEVLRSVKTLPERFQMKIIRHFARQTVVAQHWDRHKESMIRYHFRDEEQKLRPEDRAVARHLSTWRDSVERQLSHAMRRHLELLPGIAQHAYSKALRKHAAERQDPEFAKLVEAHLRPTTPHGPSTMPRLGNPNNFYYRQLITDTRHSAYDHGMRLAQEDLYQRNLRAQHPGAEERVWSAYERDANNMIDQINRDPRRGVAEVERRANEPNRRTGGFFARFIQLPPNAPESAIAAARRYAAELHPALTGERRPDGGPGPSRIGIPEWARDRHPPDPPPGEGTSRQHARLEAPPPAEGTSGQHAQPAERPRGEGASRQPARPPEPPPEEGLFRETHRSSSSSSDSDSLPPGRMRLYGVRKYSPW